MPKRFGFSKAERLKSRKQIDELFVKGKAFSVFPIRTVYQILPVAEKRGWQVGVSVSKRNFKKAVHRNRIKRLLREAYRLQKEELTLKMNEAKKSGHVFFIYTDKMLPDFEPIKAAMAKCLHRLGKMIDIENPS